MLDFKMLKKNVRKKDIGKPILKKQNEPVTIKLELTKGCNLQCSFCAISTIQKKPGKYKFLTIKTVKRLANEIARLGWKPRIECAMRGEPLANPKYIEIFKILNDTLPNSPIIVSTNGRFLLKGDVSKNIDNILYYITSLCIEDYKHTNYVNKILKLYKGKYKFQSYKNKTAYIKSKKKKLIIFPDISLSIKGKRESNTRRLNNMGGNVGYLDFSKMKIVCTRPFREFVVLYNGDVTFCCVDWKGKYKIGNIHENKIDDIWNSPLYVASRKMLYFYGRVFGTCYGCNMTTFYGGLLPDKIGITTMGDLTNEEVEMVKKISNTYKRFKGVLSDGDLHKQHRPIT